MSLMTNLRDHSWIQNLKNKSHDMTNSYEKIQLYIYKKKHKENTVNH